MKTQRVVAAVVFLGLPAMALVLPACAYLIGEWGGAPTVAASRDAIKFSHKKHVVDEALSCTDCHDGVQGSAGLGAGLPGTPGRFLPMEAKCMDCHEKTKDGCKMCHARPDQPTTWQDPRMAGLKFDHKAHVTRLAAQGQKPGCATCHADITKATRVSQDTRPAMLQACTQCHQDTFRTENCSNCHTDLPRTASRPSTLFDHSGDWLRRHGTVAKGNAMACGHCHAEPSCTECHAKNQPIRPTLLHLERVDAATVHRGDWLPRHAMEARLDGKACLACHTESTCLTCHERTGVATAKMTGSFGPHPPGWLTRGGHDSHGRAARREPLACAACHDQGAASNCVTCHRSGGPGGDPHPPGWQSQLDRQTAAACIPCHR